MHNKSLFNRAPELIWAVLSTYVSVSIEHYSWSGFLHETPYPWMYGALFVVIFSTALASASRKKDPWKDVIRVIFFFAAVIFITITFPNDIARVFTIGFGILHFFLPNLSISSRGKSLIHSSKKMA
ncbi:hypothetical protein [Corynebacterium mastitidis]